MILIQVLVGYANGTVTNLIRGNLLLIWIFSRLIEWISTQHKNLLKLTANHVATKTVQYVIQKTWLFAFSVRTIHSQTNFYSIQ